MNGNKGGGIVAIVFLIVVFAVLFASCDSGSSYHSYSGSSYSNNKSSTKRNGYDMPNNGESLPDYIRRVDPDLYNTMQDRWNTAQKNGW